MIKELLTKFYSKSLQISLEEILIFFPKPPQSKLIEFDQVFLIIWETEWTRDAIHKSTLSREEKFSSLISKAGFN